jgi:hypothetical protein
VRFVGRLHFSFRRPRRGPPPALDRDREPGHAHPASTVRPNAGRGAVARSAQVPKPRSTAGRCEAGAGGGDALSRMVGASGTGSGSEGGGGGEGAEGGATPGMGGSMRMPTARARSRSRSAQTGVPPKSRRKVSVPVTSRSSAKPAKPSGRCCTTTSRCHGALGASGAQSGTLAASASRKNCSSGQPSAPAARVYASRMITCGPPPCAAGAGASSVPKRRAGGAGAGGGSARAVPASAATVPRTRPSEASNPRRRMVRGGPHREAASMPRPLATWHGPCAVPSSPCATRGSRRGTPRQWPPSLLRAYARAQTTRPGLIPPLVVTSARPAALYSSVTSLP